MLRAQCSVHLPSLHVLGALVAGPPAALVAIAGALLALPVALVDLDRRRRQLLRPLAVAVAVAVAVLFFAFASTRAARTANYGLRGSPHRSQASSR